MTTVNAPDLGMDNAVVSEILVAEGDTVAKDDSLITIESDKASVEVPSSHAGTISKILLAVGDDIAQGDAIVELSESDADQQESPTDPEAKADSDGKDTSQQSQANNDSVSEHKDSEMPNNGEAKPSKGQDDNDADSASKEIEVTLPDLGVDQAQVSEILVSQGDQIDKEQAVLVLESDKASMEVPCDTAGEVIEVLVAVGDTVSQGQAYLKVASQQSSSSRQSEAQDDADDRDTQQVTTEQNNNSNQPTDDSKSKENKDNTQQAEGQSTTNASESYQDLTQVYAGPAVRQLARQMGLDITQIEGSAKQGRIVKEDIYQYVKQTVGQSKAANSGQSTSNALPDLPDMSNKDIWGEAKTQTLSRLQQVSIPQLNYNTLLPQVTQFDKADITETEALRKSLKPDLKQQDISLTILAFIVKATAYALTQHPKFNSHLADDNQAIIQRESVHIGIAVATPNGLLVPVLRDADKKGITQIAQDLQTLASKARDKKLSKDDMTGASFTISSQGSLGGTAFTPLVNWPQVAILGVSEASKQPTWDEQRQQFQPRLILPLSLSYDHRVINGADAAVFTRYIANLLADIRRILL